MTYLTSEERIIEILARYGTEATYNRFGWKLSGGIADGYRVAYLIHHINVGGFGIGTKGIRGDSDAAKRMEKEAGEVVAALEEIEQAT